MAKQKQVKVVKDKKERPELKIGNDDGYCCLPVNLLTKLERWVQLAATMNVADLEILGLLWPNVSESNIQFVQERLKDPTKSSQFPVSSAARVAVDFLEQVSMRDFIQGLFRIGLPDCADQLPKAPQVSDEPPF